MAWFDGLRRPEFETWVVETASGSIIRQGQRLDPFATSMRDFKAVSDWLDGVSSGQSLIGDETQHLVDLRAADLVGHDDTLTPLGTEVRRLWAAVGANDSLENHELVRCLAYITSGLGAGNNSISAMRDFWIELREVFTPLILLDAPDTLYFVSYLNKTASNYNPWDEVRLSGTALPESPLRWLEGEAEAARQTSGDYADSLDNLRKRVVDFSTRSFGRVTFCVALEITVIPQSGVPGFLDRVGHSDLLPQCYSVLGAKVPGDADQKRAERVAQRRESRVRRARSVSSDAPTPWSPDPDEDADAEERRIARRLRAERANLTHHAATVAGAKWFEKRGFEVTEADYDMLAIRGSLSILVEVKSIHDLNERRQTMSAIGQLAFYRALNIPGEFRSDVVRVVLYDHRPVSTDALEAVSSEGIVGAWLTEGDDLEFYPSRFAAVVEGPELRDDEFEVGAIGDSTPEPANG